MTWNVLADAYIRPDWFPFTDPELLKPGARQRAVVDLLVSFDADVIALQEADPALLEAVTAALPQHVVLWAPKGRQRPDGCLTAVRRTLPVSSEHRVEYSDGIPASGHVAHLVTVDTGTGPLTLANTHWRYVSGHEPAGDHIAVRQCQELVAALSDDARAVVLMDSNDLPGGPARSLLSAAGFCDAQAPGPTCVDGDRRLALDVIAVRGLPSTPVPTGLAATQPMPTLAMPSDHLPLVTALEL